MVHALAGGRLDGADARRRAARSRGRSPGSRSAAARSSRRSSSCPSSCRRWSSRPRSSRCSRMGSSGRSGRSSLRTSSSTSRSSCASSGRSGPGSTRGWTTPQRRSARRLAGVTSSSPLPSSPPPSPRAASIVFLFCFTSFGVIVVLGGIRYATLEVEIYNQAARLFDLRAAAALALLQLAAVAATVLVSGRLERRLGGARSRRGPAPRPIGRDRVRVGLAVGCSLALLALPPLALVVRSLRVADGYGLDHYASLLDETPALLVVPWHAILNSLLFAGAARRDRAHGRCPGGRGGGAGTAGARRAADAAARRLGGDARVRLPARVRRPPARPPLVRPDRPDRTGARRDPVRRPLARPRAPRGRGTARRGRRGARGVAVAGEARDRAAAPRTAAGRRGGSRVRGRARRVRRDGVRRARRLADRAGRDLPLPRPAGRRQRRHGDGALGDAHDRRDGGRARRPSAPSSDGARGEARSRRGRRHSRRGADPRGRLRRRRPRASGWPCSGRAARGSRRSCGSSRGSSRRRPAACSSTTAT